MKVTNLAVWQAREPLQGLLAEPLPVKTAYALARLASKINEQVAVIEQVRVGLVRQHGTKNEQGQLVVVQDSADWTAFATAFNELMAQEAELDVAKVTLTDVGALRVSPATLMALGEFVAVAE